MEEIIAVAINKSFFDTLPRLKTVKKDEAEIAWFIYDLVPVKDRENDRYQLRKIDTFYTGFQDALFSITTALPGKIEDFVRLLQKKLDEQLETPPNSKTLDKPF